MDFSALFVIGFLWIVGASLGFLFLYWAIRLAVLHALRQLAAETTTTS